jgi:hypothetical protein
MIALSWRHGDGNLVAFHRTIAVSNKFYEILTQTPGEYVVQTTNADGSDGVPYKPAPFPVGIWNVRAPQARTSIYTAPFFIPTDAHQLVDEWELDEHGLYKCLAGRQVMDWGYGVHHSQIDYTFGCLRMLDIPDVLFLVASLKEAAGEKIEMEVLA